MTLVQPLFDGPIDIVGDIHGEHVALHELLDALGYVDGFHPDRRLVFVGDLCDRGPDSPGVIAFVRDLVVRGLAQCVLGNHELNLLRADSKHGNRWFTNPSHEEQRREFATSAAINPAHKPATLAFLATLPLALERPDLRVVHAAWHVPSIDALRGFHDVIAAFDHYERITDQAIAELAAAAIAELAGRDVHQRSPAPPLLEAVAARDVLHQNGNPVRVLTSGLERVATRPFWASGKWRMVDRVRWWHDYDASIPVVIGHYWRNASPVLSGNKPDAFDGAPKTAWFGPLDNVYCVDFSVGGRYYERTRGLPYTTHLGALRWPERELVLDDGSRTRLA